MFYSNLECYLFHGQNHTQQAPCMNCSQQQLWNSHGPEPQWNAKNLNGSNMSLNLPQFYPQQFDMNGTTWMNNSSYRNPYAFGVIPNGKKKRFSLSICVETIIIHSFNFRQRINFQFHGLIRVYHLVPHHQHLARNHVNRLCRLETCRIAIVIWNNG